jgi:hypothetical protein
MNSPNYFDVGDITTYTVVSSAFSPKQDVNTAVVGEGTEITGHKPISPGNVFNTRKYGYSKSLFEETAEILKKPVIFYN